MTEDHGKYRAIRLTHEQVEMVKQIIVDFYEDRIENLFGAIESLVETHPVGILKKEDGDA